MTTSAESALATSCHHRILGILTRLRSQYAPGINALLGHSRRKASITVQNKKTLSVCQIKVITASSQVPQMLSCIPN